MTECKYTKPFPALYESVLSQNKITFVIFKRISFVIEKKLNNDLT